MTRQEYNDLMLLWNTINSPMKAGRKWCQYTRPSIDDAIEALKRRMVAAGFQYKEDVCANRLRSGGRQCQQNILTW